MEIAATRDLGCAELWQESLERSLARRGKLPRCSVEMGLLRPARDLSRGDALRESAAYWELRRRATRERSPMPLVALGSLSCLALVAANTLPGLLGGRAGQQRAERLAFAVGPGGGSGKLVREVAGLAVEQQPAYSHASIVAKLTAPARATVPSGPNVHSRAPTVARTPAVVRTASTRTAATAASTHPTVQADAAVASKAHAASALAHRGTSAPRHAAAAGSVHHTGGAAVGSVPREIRRHPHHRAAAPASHRPAAHHAAPTSPGERYVNPLAGASVTPERIDQGVDYSAGSGPITAIGDGTITYAASSNTGWPGAFVEYQLTSGPDAGRYVYYAEGVAPAPGLHVGQQVHAGQTIVNIVSGWSAGIEIGWGSGIGTETYAAANGEWASGSDSGNVATPSGRSFSALVVSLGGPGGLVEG